MKPTSPALVLVVAWCCAHALRLQAQTDLRVENYEFAPAIVDTLVHPDQIRFVIGNDGPQAVNYVAVEYLLSRNTTAGDADDVVLASLVYGLYLGAGQGGQVVLEPVNKNDITVPAEAAGNYYALLRVTPLGEGESDPSDNIAVCGQQVTVRPIVDIYAVFADDPIVTRQMTITPKAGCAYNLYYGNNWRLLGPGGGFTGTFTVPAAGRYTMRVRHATSYSQSCPNNGYSPVNIFINGAQVASNFDPAQMHGTWWYENDTWIIDAQQGDNTLQWVAGPLCTHYWLQRIEFSRLADPPRITSITRTAEGMVRLTMEGEAGRTNLIEVSTNLVDWVPAASVVVSGGLTEWEAPATGLGGRFYRLLQLVP